MLAVALAVPLGEASADALDAESRVAGLPLVLRAVLTLQKHGATEIAVVVHEDEGGVVERVRADPRTRAAIVEHVARADDPLASLASLGDEPLLLARYDRVADDAIYAQLLAQELDGKAGALAVRDDEPLGPMRASGAALAAAGSDLAGWRDRGDIVRLEVGDRWVADVSTPSGRRQAVRQLFEACRKPTDGIVSRNLNRRISLFISRLLVDTPITPNMMTVATFLVAVAAAYAALDGSYSGSLIAGLLIQLNSILDGCDGELARVRFQGSKLGQWLDTVADDASNVMFWSAFAIGASNSGLAAGEWLSMAGWVAAVANALAALLNYALLAGSGSGDFYSLANNKRPAAGFINGVVRVFSTVLSQDFFLFVVMCAAIAGIVHYWLPLLALGALITLGNAIVRTFRARAAKHTRAAS